MKPTLFRFALALMSLAGVLAVLEGAFRALDLRGYHLPRTREWSHALLPPRDRQPGLRVQFKPHSQFTFRYDSNPRGYFDADNGLTYRLNNLGLRGSDISFQKPVGRKRVLLLGDSFTFGEGVRLEHTLSEQLQGRLRSRHPRVEVLNFGVSNWGTRDEINYLALVGTRFQPDLVIVVFVLNDAEYAGGLDVWNTFREVYENRALRASYFLSWAYARVAQPIFVRNYVENLTQRSLAESEPWNDALEELRRGKRISETGGARFAVVIYPFMYDLSPSHPFLEIHRMIEDYCRKSGIPVRDLLSAFEGRNHASLWVHPSDPHPNEEAQLLAARALDEFIEDDRLLD